MLHQIQTSLSLLYPPRCLGCGALVESEFGLCGACWRETPFIGGLVCDACGAPVQGAQTDHRVECDACMKTPRPWSMGRATMLYRGKGRDLVLALKHSDRADIAGPAGRWMARAARPLIRPDTLILPVPLHWSRVLRRKYNQSALLAKPLGLAIERPVGLDVLRRVRKTVSLDHRPATERFLHLSGAIQVAPDRIAQIRQRSLLLVDDVMTSGATLSACTEACLDAGASEVCVLVLARVAKET